MKTTNITKTTILLTLALLLGVFAVEARAATFTVNQLGDAGDGVCDASCTLRDAVLNANSLAGADTIVFAAPLFDTPQTIILTGNLASFELAISQSVTITGTGARLLTVRRSAVAGTPGFRIFNITGAAGTIVNITGITISNGNTTDFGGGVNNSNGGVLTLNGVAVSGNSTVNNFGGGIRSAIGTTTILNSTVSGNAAGTFGGGIRISSGTVNIADSTVSGNTAAGSGGGSLGGGIDNSGTLNMNNVTITNNSATGFNTQNTGGVLNFSGTVNTRNTIISGNTATNSTSPDVNGAFVSNGNNLIGSATGATGFSTAAPTLDRIGAAANLAALDNNGGQTNTHALLAGSAAIDAGNSCVVTGICGVNNPLAPLVFDQRGAPATRLLGLAVDIGAFEFGARAPTAGVVTVSGRALTSDGRGIRNVMIRMIDSRGATRIAVSTTFGYYRFADVATGETYIFTVKGKRFEFTQPTQVLNVGENTTDVNFIASPR